MCCVCIEGGGSCAYHYARERIAAEVARDKALEEIAKMVEDPSFLDPSPNARALAASIRALAGEKK